MIDDMKASGDHGYGPHTDSTLQLAEQLMIDLKTSKKSVPDQGGDGTNIKIEDIETVNKTKAQMAKDEEYLKMQKVAYLHYLEQQKTRQAYLDNFRQMFLANKGGLAGLFRVKNT